MRMLLIEDEDEVADVLWRKLKSLDYAVDRAGSMAEARDALEHHRYRLVLLDRRLPDGDGVSLVPDVRRSQPEARVVIVSACDKTQEIVNAFEGGADDYVTKPFHFDELMARIRNQLRRGDAQPLPTIGLGGLVFDPHLRAVSVNGAPVVLHGRELMMLEVLLRHAGRMVSRQALIDEIYDHSDSVEPRAVNLVAQRLRSRLTALDAGVEIHAARGVGYMLTRA
jgi:DNA-binding response OmpR family regulator